MFESSLWQKQQAVWFAKRMVYSTVSYKRLFWSLNDVTLATVKTTIVYKTSNNDNFNCVRNKNNKNVIGIHHSIYKLTLKFKHQVQCFPDQNKTCGNTFRNDLIELNSIIYPPTDPLSDGILVKLNKQKKERFNPFHWIYHSKFTFRWRGNIFCHCCCVHEP